MTVLNDTDWEVPTHEVQLYGDKRHDYALVIPVINEGTRLLGQLDAIADLQPPVDIIIADGGSDDVHDPGRAGAMAGGSGALEADGTVALYGVKILARE